MRVRFNGQLRGRRRLGAGRRHRLHRHAAAAGARALRRARPHPAGRPAGAGGRRPVRGHRRATSCGWPCRRDARPPRSGRPRLRTRCPSRPTRPASAATRPARRCSPRSPRAGRRGRSGRRCRARTGPPGWSSCAGRRCPDGGARWSSSRTARTSTALAAAAGRLLPEHSFTVLRADDSPEKRYRQFLAASRGAAQVVLGTRAAMFAPVRDLGLVVIWDDGDDLHAETARPYPHARDVLVQRAWLDNCAAVVAGTPAPPRPRCWSSPAGRTSWPPTAPSCAPPRPGCRRSATTSSWPATRPPGRPGCRRWRTRPPAARSPRVRRCSCRCRAGDTCRRWPAPAAAPRPAARTAPGRWASRRAPGPAARASRPAAGAPGPAATFDCPHCHGTKLRAAVVGESRTAEELARAFPGTTGPHVRAAPPACWRRCPPARLSWSPRRARSRWPRAATAPRCCWTPGRCWAGPTCGRGRRPCAAGSTRPRWSGPRAPAGRWSSPPMPATPSSRRSCAGTRPGWPTASWPTGASSGFPPVTRIASLAGSPAALAEFLEALRLPEGADLLGPVPEPPRPGQEGERERYLVRVPRAEGLALAHALTEVAGRAQRQEGRRARARAAGPARPRLAAAHGAARRSASRASSGRAAAEAVRASTIVG